MQRMLGKTLLKETVMTRDVVQQSLSEETVFVDDGPRNIEAAAAMGMHTLCPQNNEDWRAMLNDVLACKG